MRQVMQFFCPREEAQEQLIRPVALESKQQSNPKPPEAKAIKPRFTVTEKETLTAAGLTLEELPQGLSNKTKIICTLTWGISLFTTIYSIFTLVDVRAKIADATDQLKDQQPDLGNATCADGWESTPAPENPCHYNPTLYPTEFGAICDQLFAAACHLRDRLDTPAAAGAISAIPTLLIPLAAYNEHTTQYYGLTASSVNILQEIGHSPKEGENATQYAAKLLDLTKKSDIVAQIKAKAPSPVATSTPI